MQADWVSVNGIVVRGHGVASGAAAENPYPAGTIDLQRPIFRALGLDLYDYHDGTLNISIHPKTFAVKNAQYVFRQVKWTALHPPEDFSFSLAIVVFRQVRYEGWLYYPHPETKRTHFQSPSVLEVIAPGIAGIEYGSEVAILLNRREIDVIPPPSENSD
jgi:hypothetical protein